MGIPYQRHKPSAVLRKFLDPLDPGSYFDCGRARLHGIDDVLLREAERRGRVAGDDSFQLVATDIGLIFCRPSISFAIAARWSEITVARPVGDEPVVMNVVWPVHGDLAFTVGKRLGGNIFRRWLQLQMRANRTEKEYSSSEPLADEASSASSEVEELERTNSPPVVVGVGAVAAANGGGVDGETAPPVDGESLAETGSENAVLEPAATESDSSSELAADRSKTADRVGPAPAVKSGRAKAVVWHDGQPVDLVEKFQLADPAVEAKRLNLDRSTDSAQQDRPEVPSAGLFEGPLLRPPGQPSPEEEELAWSKIRSGKIRGQKPRRLSKSEDKRNSDDDPALISKSAKTSEMAAVVDEQTKPVTASSEAVDRGSELETPHSGKREEKASQPRPPRKGRSDLAPEVDPNSSEVSEPGLEADRNEAKPIGEAVSHVGDRSTTDEATSSANERGGAVDGAAEGERATDTAASDSGSANDENDGGEEPVGVTEGERSGDEQESKDRSANRKLSLLELLASDQENGPIPQTGKLAAVVTPIISKDSEDDSTNSERLVDVSDLSGASEVEDSSWLPPESVGDFAASDISSDRASRLVEFPIAMAIAVLVIGTFLSVVAASRFAPSSDEIAGGAGPSSTIDNLRYRVGFEDPDLEEETVSQIRPVGQPPAGPGVGQLALESDDDQTSDGESVGREVAEVEPGGSGSSPTEEAVSVPTTPSSVEGKARTDSVLCNSNYSGCVPDVSDVDCEGDGDGPAYIDKPVLVLGTDVYLLDTDSDGNACEPGQPESNGRRVSTP